MHIKYTAFITTAGHVLQVTLLTVFTQKCLPSDNSHTNVYAVLELGVKKQHIFAEVVKKKNNNRKTEGMLKVRFHAKRSCREIPTHQ